MLASLSLAARIQPSRLFSDGRGLLWARAFETCSSCFRRATVVHRCFLSEKTRFRSLSNFITLPPSSLSYFSSLMSCPRFSLSMSPASNSFNRRSEILADQALSSLKFSTSLALLCLFLLFTILSSSTSLFSPNLSTSGLCYARFSSSLSESPYLIGLPPRIHLGHPFSWIRVLSKVNSSLSVC